MIQAMHSKALCARTAGRSARAVAPRFSASVMPSRPSAFAQPAAPRTPAARRAMLARAAYAEAPEAAEPMSEEEALATTTQVFVGNLPWTVGEEDLGDAFSSVPGLSRAYVMRRDGRSRGMAILDFETHEQAEQAVRDFHETDLGGRTVSVRLSVPRPRRDGGGDRQPRERRAYEPRADRGEGRPRRSENPNGVKLFVGNLSFNSQWQEVKDHFASAGSVDYVSVRTTPEGRSRGFAIVQMSDESAAAAALMDLDGSELGGRQLSVRRFEARERNEEYSQE